MAKYGFQLSPRLGSAPATDSGGSLRADSLGIFVQCADGNPVPAGGCPERAPLYFAQHRRPSLEPVWELDWTPPQEATGPIELFLALNAANGRSDQSGDRIFLNSVVVKPAGQLTFRQPFGGGGASPSGWLEIYGSGLSSVTSVTVGGRSAVIEFASGGQVNVRIAPDAALGWQTVVTQLDDGRAIESPIYLTAASPSLFTTLPEVAVGETAVLYGTGCGRLDEPAQAEIRMNHRSYPGMAYASPGLAGLCQVQFVAPEIEPGPYLLHVCIEGTCNGQRLRLQVR